MKKIFFYGALLSSLAVVSCNKETNMHVIKDEASLSQEIVLGVGDGFDASVTTKATAITNVPSSLYWAASTGESGSETIKWEPASKAVSSNKIYTGKYQTATPTTYNYYVSNENFVFSASGTTITVADNDTDVLSARVSSNSTTPAIVLGHIFARTGTLTLNTQSDYSLSNISWKIVGKSSVNGTAGTFNMTTNAWTAASTKLSSQTAITSSSDMYLIPGTYTVYVSYTLTKDNWSQSFEKHADITLQQGKINNISGTANGGDATEIVLNLSVADWGAVNLTLPTLE